MVLVICLQQHPVMQKSRRWSFSRAGDKSDEVKFNCIYQTTNTHRSRANKKSGQPYFSLLSGSKQPQQRVCRSYYLNIQEIDIYSYVKVELNGSWEFLGKKPQPCIRDIPFTGGNDVDCISSGLWGGGVADLECKTAFAIISLLHALDTNHSAWLSI